MRRTGEAAYTLVELAVALSLMLLLGAVLFAVLLAATRQIEPWRREVTLETYAHLLTRRLAADLLHAEQLHEAGAGRWELTFRSGRAVTYRHENGRLTRNGRPMHPPTLSVVDFRLVPARAETRYAPRHRDAPLDDERTLLPVALHLRLENRARTLDVATTLALRQHRPWPPQP